MGEVGKKEDKLRYEWQVLARQCIRRGSGTFYMCIMNMIIVHSHK